MKMIRLCAQDNTVMKNSPPQGAQETSLHPTKYIPPTPPPPNLKHQITTDEQDRNRKRLGAQRHTQNEPKKSYDWLTKYRNETLNNKQQMRKQLMKTTTKKTKKKTSATKKKGQMCTGIACWIGTGADFGTGEIRMCTEPGIEKFKL